MSNPEPLEFSTTAQLSKAHGVKGVIYGTAGGGKTMLAATAPRPLLVMAENGTLSLTPENIARVFGAGRADITYNIPVVRIKSYNQLDLLYKRIFTQELWYNFDTLYIDSATEIVEQILDHAHENNRDGRAAYGDLFELTRAWFKQIRDLPGKNAFLTCEQGLLKDSGLFGPSMPGNMLDQKTPYLFDLILQMTMYEDPNSKALIRYLRTQPDLKNYAKDRSGGLDPSGELPHLGNIIRKASGGNA